MKKQKVIIIGAGPAGLTAAYKLLKENKSYDVTILEASNDIGGISKTINYKGNRMDLGGHRFFSKNKDVNLLWQEIMPLQAKPSYDDKLLHKSKKLSKKGPDPEKNDKVMLKRNRVSRIYYLNKFFDYPVSLKVATLKNMGIKTTFHSGFSYLKSTLIKREENNLENFYVNRFGRKLYSMFFEGYTEKLWGRHPKEISASWGSQRVKGLSIRSVLKDSCNKLFHVNHKEKETSLIEEFMYPKYGPGQLWETMAEEIKKMGGNILLNCEVDRINVKNDKIISVCSTNHNEYKGDIFISSMPLKDFINGMKNVPKKINNIANGLPYRDFITIGLLLKKLKLKNETDIKTINNIVPDCWIYVQDTTVKLGRIQIFNNWSPYLVQDINNTCWIGLEYFCNEDDDFWKMPDETRVKLAISELIKMNVIDEKDVLDYTTQKVKKAYPAYFDTYKDIDQLREYLNTFDNLYCVGRNGQHRYNNMDHSMLTSFEAVNNIINNVKSKDNIWNVNTEGEYHEETSK